MLKPVCKEIPYQDPITIFAKFADQSGSLLLESAQLMKECGRYSFIAVDPFFILTSKNDANNPFVRLSELLAKYPLVFHENLPPFQGGVAGFLGYELYQHLEKIQTHQKDDMAFSDLVLGFYDVVIAFDHVVQRAWIFSSGYPETEKREEHALQRLNELAEKISVVETLPSLSVEKNQHALHANFSQEEYQFAVQKTQNYILSGDIFEANISQRFQTTLSSEMTAFDLYRKLRAINPAPFAAYFSYDDMTLVSASPERFLKLTAGLVQARPIKGTRRRGKTAEEDRQLANELLNSEKDQAENVMIVDLLRNDLSRVCVDHSVQVPQLCELESYATVHHLVSVVTGKLQESLTAVDLLCATFPGGSITGAPKIRAMEIIAEIEPTQRGPYCGSIGYIGFNGDMDMSITIRTFALKNKVVTFQAGGAVVIDSDPLAEYEETLTKTRALKKALYDFVD